MNYKIVSPQHINYEVSLPASKSISNRALIINALSNCKCNIKNIAKCDDTDAMINALASSDSYINIGAAGTAMRFLTAYFAIKCNSSVTIDGSERMRMRPIKILVDALRLCGANITYLKNEGFPPILVKGTNLKTAKLELPGNVSSQYISALLMIAPIIEGGLTITLSGDIISLPYIKMTLSIMQEFGVNATMSQNVITIPQGNYASSSFTVESDWSAASYWYQLVALHPFAKITLKGLHLNSVQGDSNIRTLFTLFGVKTDITTDGMVLSSMNRTEHIKYIGIDLRDKPDIAQTIVVTACMLNIPFDISGLSTLKIKETDRIEALRSQLLKLGYCITARNNDTLSWDDTRTEPDINPSIATFDDHRMAMAFAPAAIIHKDIIIENIEVVSKSYPNYWEHLNGAGFNLIKQ
ncbi:MAG: 3-phosphoshikimate 1-carboxyvinyltransferase [Muribaculaceae bacterium]